MGRFRKGVSGNPAGRREGSRNRASLLCDKIAESEVAGVMHAMIRKAKQGDVAAASLVFRRCWPPRRARVLFPMPALTTTADLPAALAAVATAISEGVLSPDEAAAVAMVLQAQMRAVELNELDRRMREIERRQKCD